MERHHVGSSVLVVIPEEIFLEPFKHFVGVVVMQDALIKVGAVAPFEAFDVVGV